MSGIKFTAIVREKTTITEGLNVEVVSESKPWKDKIVKYLEEGPFPPAQAQKKFIIVAVEYFSKWVEAEAVAKIMEKETINFIWNNIICRFGISRILISDNGEESQRIMMYDPKSNQSERSFDLTTIEEKRETAYARILHHKGMMMRNNDRKVRPRQLQVGDLVPKKVEASRHVGTLDPSCEGPYKVVEIKRKEPTSCKIRMNRTYRDHGMFKT
ncbi:UNVERIFIED_CONTAM: hypothetical protein Sindi_0474600 [Sesamum indicum]